MARGREDERLAVIARREDVLGLVVEEPRRQAAIADILDVSRSTVTRAITELQELGLVERTGGSYTVTSLGRVVLEGHRRYTSLIRNLFDCEGLLEYIPPEAPFDPFLLSDGACYLVEQGASFQIRERVNQEFRNADRIVGLGRTRSAKASMDIFYEKVIEEGIPAENVLSADLYSHIVDLDRGEELLSAANMEYAVHDDIPYGLFILGRGDGRTLVVVVYDESDSMKGVVTSQSPFATAWAETVYQSYLDEAIPPEDLED